MSAQPIIVVERRAVDQWRNLRRAGVVTGVAQKRIGRVLPAPGTPAELSRRVVSVRAGVGEVRDPAGAWAATFRKDRRADGRRVWVVESIEARR